MFCLTLMAYLYGMVIHYLRLPLSRFGSRIRNSYGRGGEHGRGGERKRKHSSRDQQAKLHLSKICGIDGAVWDI